MPSEKSPERVNHPPHYTAYGGPEIIEVCEHLNFNRGNSVKYIVRAGFKNPLTTIEDLKKAQWYLTREIELLEKKSASDWARE